MIRTKEERAVLDDRTADRTADLIFDAERCLSERFLIKIARGIQSIVVVKPESRTVEVVTAALGHNVHDRPCRAPVLGCELVRDQPDLLNDVGIVDRLRAARHAGFIGVLAVDHEIVRPKTRTID